VYTLQQEWYVTTAVNKLVVQLRHGMKTLKILSPFLKCKFTVATKLTAAKNITKRAAN